MKTRNKCILMFLTLFLMLPVYNFATACTRVLIADNHHAVMVGRSMDWYEDTKTNLFFYPRHMQRVGNDAGHPDEKNWLSWESKYASLVATAYDNFTNDGFNEAGFSVHILWLEPSQYGERDPSKPGLSLTQWAQYYLDNFKSVDEAVAFTEAQSFQVLPFFYKATNEWGKLHLVLDDVSGDSAVIEYVHGKLRIYHDKRYVVTTNEPTFDKQLLNLKRYKVFGGDKPLPGNDQSKARFVRATYYASKLAPFTSTQNELAALFSVLNNTAKPYTEKERTIWHAVSDLTNKVYYFQSKEYQQLITVRLDQFNVNATAAMKLDLVNHPEYAGDVSDKFQA